MAEAVFLDFYGTVVHEDGAAVRRVMEILCETGQMTDMAQIGSFWGNAFQSACLAAYGDAFRLQRELEYGSIADTVAYVGSDADPVMLSNMLFAHWVCPPIFVDAVQFLAVCPLPVYLVSNIDRDDILQAVAYHGLKPDGIFTSEDARSYKPRPELFQYALQQTGLAAEQVVHIGDSLSSDVRGAAAVGIPAVWVNRSGRTVPEGVVGVDSLADVLALL